MQTLKDPWNFLLPFNFYKINKDYFSLLDDYGEPFFVWVLFVSLLKFKSFDQFNPPELHQFLDIYSVVML